MTVLIAEIYIEEMEKWKDTIEVHDQQLAEMEGWMKDLMRTDTPAMPGIIAEDYINQIGLAKHHDNLLQKKIKAFEEQLYDKHVPLRNNLLPDTLHWDAKNLRRLLYHNELAYQRLMFNCDEFLADSVSDRIDWNTGWSKPSTGRHLSTECQNLLNTNNSHEYLPDH